MRVHLFELEDLKWFPEPVRSGATDYLRFLLKTLKFYEPAASMISEIVQKENSNFIVDLCSGGGGPAEQIASKLNGNVQLILTDKFPNVRSWRYIRNKSNDKISFVSHSVDAFSEQEPFKGPRSMFSAIHHFKPEDIQRIVNHCSKGSHSILFFDGGNKNMFMILGLLVIHPVFTILAAPFLKPFRLSRIFFTWILPLIPLVTVWDGFVSILRLYRPEELMRIAKKAAPHYHWKAGFIKSYFGLRIAFLYGSLNDPAKKK